ncbi:MAG: hypothetical protein K0Q79_3714 [Flavipsychrobacter sp.]|jgi:hypothetical protein|nr:hypothetical protein [Flavipsychrobacter sp.]
MVCDVAMHIPSLVTSLSLNLVHFLLHYLLHCKRLKLATGKHFGSSLFTENYTQNRVFYTFYPIFYTPVVPGVYPEQ